MENAGDVVGVADDIEDAHATAALAADGRVDGEHSSEQVGPTETALLAEDVAAKVEEPDAGNPHVRICGGGGPRGDLPV